MSRSAKDRIASGADRAETTPSTDAQDGARLVRGLSVAEVLGTAVLRGSEVLAGARGLQRPVQRLNVMESPDSLEWVKPHELVLTTGYLLQAAGDLATLAAELDERRVSALAVKLGRHLH